MGECGGDVERMDKGDKTFFGDLEKNPIICIFAETGSI